MQISTGLAALVVAICAAGAQARVTRVVVEKRESPAFGGQTFGKAGAYEILGGRFYGEIDPKDPTTASSTTFSSRRGTRGAWWNTRPCPPGWAIRAGTRIRARRRSRRSWGQVLVAVVAERFLLREDADRLIAEAAASNVLK